MQIDTPDTRRSLERMVARLTPQRFWHEDLVQEALIHWWQEECRCPGRSASWYLRSCEFYLLNRMRLGRSIDSPKRSNGAVTPRPDAADPEDFLDSLPDSTAGASVIEAVVARDFVSALLQRLRPMDRKVLACLAEGLGARETARRLNLSHTWVTKRRRAIAALVFDLEPQTRSRITTAHHSSGHRQNGIANGAHRKTCNSTLTRVFKTVHKPGAAGPEKCFTFGRLSAKLRAEVTP